MTKNSPTLLNNPYGNASFDEFRQDEAAFADKTDFIAELDKKSMTKYPVLLRPRRFGKSTFVKMLKCFYDLSYKERYEELFSQTAIYEKNLSSKNTYHVIDFDFSGISGNDVSTLVNDFIIAINCGIDDFKERYPDFVFKPKKNETKTPSGLLKTFLSAYKKFSSKKLLYVMIDEYDNFSNKTLSRDLDLFKAITGADSFLKAFYEAIKSGTKNSIAKTFITGVSSVSLDSLSSGFNISINVTSEPEFNTYAGFTENELRILIPKLVDIDNLGVDTDEIIARMKPVYDGYCFSKDTSQTLYNSSMCLYYLRSITKSGSLLPPEQYLDPASDHDGSKLNQLFEIAENGLENEIIDTYLSGDSFLVKKLAQNIDLNEKAAYDREKLLSMLYYMGYLTIDPEASDEEMLALRIPNLFMAELFARCAVNLRLTTDSVFTACKLDISALNNSEDDLSSFAVSCTEFLSSIVTNPVLTHMNEMALNLTLYAKLSLLRGIQAAMQKPLRVPGEGEKFADLVVTVNRSKSNECTYLFELKYLPKNSGKSKKDNKDKNYESELRRLKKEAENEALMYSSALDFRGKQVKAYVMIFQGPKCILCEKQN